MNNMILRKQILRELKYLLNEEANESIAFLRKHEDTTDYLLKVRNYPEVKNELFQHFKTAYSRNPYVLTTFPRLAELFTNSEKSIIQGGKWSDEEQQAFEKDYNSSPSPPSPSPTPPGAGDGGGPRSKISCKPCRGVGLGCTDQTSNGQVSKIQKILQKVVPMQVFDKREIDEKRFGLTTEKAVQTFQKIKKLNADGLVGPKTCAAMGLMNPVAKKLIPPADNKDVPPADNKDVPPADNKDVPQADNKDVPPAGYPGPNANPSPIRESLNYFESKKLFEAKKLFNKLLKAL